MENPITWQSFFEGLLVALAPLAVSALTLLAGTGVQWLRKKLKQVELEIGTVEYSILVDFTKRMIDAAEQSGVQGYIENVGYVKKEWVMDKVTAFLEANGIAVDLDAIEDLIEGLVFDKIQIPPILDEE